MVSRCTGHFCCRLLLTTASTPSPDGDAFPRRCHSQFQKRDVIGKKRHGGYISLRRRIRPCPYHLHLPTQLRVEGRPRCRQHLLWHSNRRSTHGARRLCRGMLSVGPCDDVEKCSCRPAAWWRQISHLWRSANGYG